MRKFVGAAILALTATATLTAATQPSPSAWFGFSLPGPATASEIPVGNLDLPPIAVPRAGTEPEFAGTRVHEYVQRLSAIADESKSAGQAYWGRISGDVWFEKSMDYAQELMRSGGVTSVDRYATRFYAPERLPIRFAATLIGDRDFGAGTEDLPLQSAYPTRTEVLTGRDGRPLLGKDKMALTAPLAYVGTASSVEWAMNDVRGKIAVIAIPASPTPFYHDLRGYSQMAEEAGAVGMLLIFDTPGNMQFMLSACRATPCFSLGGRDGAFVREAMARAKRKGRDLRMRMEIDSETRDDKTSSFIIARVAGRSSAQNVIVMAHGDTVLTGANDDSSGMAMVAALARYYAKRKPAYDMYFVITPGHHSPTGGSRSLVERFPDLPRKNLISVNIEHVAQVGLYRSYFGILAKTPTRDAFGRFTFPYVATNWDSQGREVSLHPDSPVIRKVWREAATRNMLTGPATFYSPSVVEPEPLNEAGANTIENVETTILYHSSGDTADMVSAASLERNLFFYRDFLNGMMKFSRRDIVADGASPAAGR